MDLREQLAAALGERYRVEREIGHGGAAVVFLAQDLKHHRRVAIKVLRAELSAVLGRDRFLREIDIAANLQHPHILPLHDSGQAGALLYYVMPFVEGESLRQRLTRERQLPIDAALQIIREAGSALQHAHAFGVVHRDIKPENIMQSGGHAMVADFGIARALHAASTDSLTQTGMVVGTPLYMSPEQALGGVVDGRSDQYSLACTLYELLTGQPPFTGPSPQAVIARHSLDPVPSLRVVRQTVPQPVEAAIMRAMAKAPADRFESVERFVDALAPGAASTAGGTALVAGPSRPRGNLPLMLTLGAGALAAGIGWLAFGRTAAGAPRGGREVKAIAVLPFEEPARNPDSSYLGEGMTDGLIVDLAEIGSLKVIARSSGAAAARDRALSLAQLGGELGVDAVVKGSIQRVGDTVRVSVRVLQPPDSALLFAREYQGRLGELPNLQREISAAIRASIQADGKGAGRSRPAAQREVDQRAYEAYLRGRFHLERSELEAARPLFEQAIQIAPDWAPPYVGLANYYTSLPFFTDVPPVAVLPKARAAVVQALALDETLAEAHAASAYIRAYFEWDWRAAELEFRRALELRPNYADAYFSYSRFLASRERLDEAIVQLARAVELDPLSLALQSNRALLEYFAGRYDEARSRLDKVLERDTTDVVTLWALALVAEQQGRPAEAITILERIAGSSNNRRASLGHAYGIAGKAAQARKVLAALDAAAKASYVPAYWFALVHAGLGDREEAVRCLERAYEERSTVLAYVLIDPRLAPLRDHPRFIALAHRLRGE